MTITHQIVDNPALPTIPGMGMLNQLSGLIGQAQSMLSAGVSLPGIQGIGAQISSMVGAITAGGGGAGSATDTSQIANVVGSLGSQLSSVASMAGVSSIVSSLSSQLSALTNLINPAGGGIAQVLHSHVLDKIGGITHSAFNGQHTVNLGSAGINLLSGIMVSHTAPKLPHNGLTLVSDALQVAKTVTGSGFGITSDAKLKSNINNHPAVLEDVLRLRLKTFDVLSYDWDAERVLDIPARPTLGLIAQEVQEVFPLVVAGDDVLTLEEGKVGMLVLGALQEFVKEARAEIALLKAEISELRAR
jgi:hypothetical protein